MASKRLQNYNIHPEMASSRPVLAQKIDIVPCSVVENNYGEDKSDEESEGSSKDSFKSCMEDLAVNHDDEKVVLGKDCPSKPKCDHQHEVGVMVASLTSQHLHLVGPLGHVWVECCVDPLACLVFIDGVRTKEVYSVKMGAMGHMVVKECIKCQLSVKTKVNPALVWFGEDLRPNARAAVGVVVGMEEGRMVVQLEGPSAARIARLVLFHGETGEDQDVGLETRVLVWAWTRQLGRGTVKFLEGAAIVNNKDYEELDKDDYVDDKQDIDQLTSEAQTSPNNRNLLRLLLNRLLYISV